MQLRHITLALLVLPWAVFAHNLHIGQHVPAVGVSDSGELRYQADNFSYRPWNSAQLTGKVRLIQHIAGRSSAKEMNAETIEAVKMARLPHDRYQTTTIVNTSDALPATGMFVRSSVEANKKQYPWAQFIVDNQGRVKQAWQLADASSAIIVLDKKGMVRFVREGALSEADVSQVVKLLRTLLNEKS